MIERNELETYRSHTCTNETVLRNNEAEIGAFLAIIEKDSKSYLARVDIFQEQI